MIDISEINRIGFGAYRVVADSKEHENALRYALDNGCNLIDTASNYTNGSSEELVGNVLSSLPGAKVFIITKAGYLSGNTLRLYEDLHIKDGDNEPVVISDTFKHSIHPGYLAAQIAMSQKRLRTSCIDCFLLHSPEYYFSSPDPSVEEYYERIERAFIFLEDMVKKGIIRYYGISSNSFVPSSASKGATSLEKVIAIANKIGSASGFKFIQFPYNLIENAAVSSLDDNGRSLISMAKENNIITLANRPLNANGDNALVRLEIKNLDDLQLDQQADENNFLSFFSILEKELDEKMPGTHFSEIPILQLLKTNWMNIGNPDSFTKIFRENFDPFIELLFEEGMDQQQKEAVKGIEKLAWKYHIKNRTTNTKSWLKKLNKEYLLDNSHPESFTINLVRDYLNSGIDHVLMGMRKTGYVDSVKTLLQKQ